MNIVIYKDSIAESLKMESSLVSKGAFSDKGSSLHDIIYIDEREFKVLDGAYQDALSTIKTVLREFLASEPISSEDSVEFSLVKANPEWTDSLAGDIESYITKRMMAQWLAMVYPPQSQRYEQSALTTLNNLKMKSYYKAPPML